MVTHGSPYPLFSSVGAAIWKNDTSHNQCIQNVAPTGYHNIVLVGVATIRTSLRDYHIIVFVGMLP